MYKGEIVNRIIIILHKESLKINLAGIMINSPDTYCKTEGFVAKIRMNPTNDILVFINILFPIRDVVRRFRKINVKKRKY